MLHAKPQQSRIWMGLAAAAIGSIALVGCSGGEDTSSTPPVASGGPSGGPGPGMGSGGGGQMPMQGGAGFPGAAPQQPQVAANTNAPKLPGPPGARPDPFKPWFNTIPPPPNVLTYTAPIRIALAGTTAPEVQPGVEIQEVPSRRVAGILNGNGVYALLDGGPAGPEVVKPGQLLDDGYRVMMINSDSVTLQKKVATQTYTQVVPLTDVGGTASVGGGGYQGPGMMGAGPRPGTGPMRAGTSSAGGNVGTGKE